MPQPPRPPAPPFEPHTFQVLVQHRPERASSILAAMRPAMLAAQAQAHAVIGGTTAERIIDGWRPLIARGRSAPLVRPSHDDSGDAVYEPERLAMAPDHEARDLIVALTPTQRVRQAQAQAMWLSGWGYPVTAAQILDGWRASYDLR